MAGRVGAHRAEQPVGDAWRREQQAHLVGEVLAHVLVGGGDLVDELFAACPKPPICWPFASSNRRTTSY
jgi:hypothetical protein